MAKELKMWKRWNLTSSLSNRVTKEESCHQRKLAYKRAKVLWTTLFSEIWFDTHTCSCSRRFAEFGFKAWQSDRSKETRLSDGRAETGDALTPLYDKCTTFSLVIQQRVQISSSCPRMIDQPSFYIDTKKKTTTCPHGSSAGVKAFKSDTLTMPASIASVRDFCVVILLKQKNEDLLAFHCMLASQICFWIQTAFLVWRQKWPPVGKILCLEDACRINAFSRQKDAWYVKKVLLARSCTQIGVQAGCSTLSGGE